MRTPADAPRFPCLFRLTPNIFRLIWQRLIQVPASRAKMGSRTPPKPRVLRIVGIRA